MQLNENKVRNIFECADRQRAIEKYLQELLYDNAIEKKCYCTWLIEYPTYNEEKGFEFKIEITSEDKQHRVKKIFYIGYEWEEEKKIMKEIVLKLLNQLKYKTNQIQN
ncbi:hypothetical protein ACWKTZ_23485 [Bacillus cereus]